MSGLTRENPTGRPCNETGLAEPFGILDLADIGLFISEFPAGCPQIEAEDCNTDLGQTLCGGAVVRLEE